MKYQKLKTLFLQKKCQTNKNICIRKPKIIPKYFKNLKKNPIFLFQNVAITIKTNNVLCKLLCMSLVIIDKDTTFTLSHHNGQTFSERSLVAMWFGLESQHQVRCCVCALTLSNTMPLFYKLTYIKYKIR